MVWSIVEKYSHNSLLDCLDYANKMMADPNFDMKEDEKENTKK